MKYIKKKFMKIMFIMNYIKRTEKKYLYYRIPEIILRAINPFVFIIFPKLIIDRLMYSESQTLFLDIVKIACLMIGTSIVINMLLVVLNTCITNAYNSFEYKHVLNIGKKIMSLKFQYIENPDMLDLFYRTKNTKYCEEMYSAITDIIINCLTCMGLFAILATLKPAIILVLLLIVFINVLCNKKVQKYNFQWHKEQTPYNRVGDYLVQLMHGFQYGKDIRVYNMESYLSSKYKKFSKGYLKALRNVTMKFLRYNAISTFANLIQQGGIYIYLSYKVIVDSLTIGNFTMLLSSVQNLTNCLINISQNIVVLGNSSNYIDEFSYIMSIKDQNSSDGGNLDVNADEFVIEFKNVSFKYPGCDNYVLQNINAKIEHNKRIAVVGTNGSGKTTFVKLLLRLYEPTSGSIELNGININQLDYYSYIKLFSSVFQDYRIYAYSIKENIAMSEQYDEERIEEIVKKINFEEKVNSFPKKLDTVMFKFLDDEGIELSGGEQQKLVIARALYKECPFMILDEPTAALDPLMEYDIYQSVNKSIHNRTIIFISHRLSITRYCDEVLVFHDGCISQRGKHSDLMKEKDKLYYEMYSKQAEFYESGEVACSK